ncbi:MAG: hypothetical protein ABIV21_05955 [Pyrinomonadaceae bacterium]
MYHVQTEDKGLASRLIVSLVYNGGTILASKRASYDDLPVEDIDEKVLSERLGRQHKLICAAVKAGRFDELKGMSAKSAKAGANAKAEPVETVKLAVPPPVLMPAAAPTAVKEVPNTVVAAPTARVGSPLPEHILPLPAARVDMRTPVTVEVFDEIDVFEAVEVIEEIIMPAEAVEVVSELSGRERPADTKLSVELLGDSKFKGGDRRTVSVMVCRGTERKVIRDAQIMIKVLGSTFRPLIFHATSDANGLANVHLQLPHFQSGRAAILIRVMSGTEQVELRRAVVPG